MITMSSISHLSSDHQQGLNPQIHFHLRLDHHLRRRVRISNQFQWIRGYRKRSLISRLILSRSTKCIVMVVRRGRKFNCNYRFLFYTKSSDNEAF